jgi:hypothetical protein
MTLLSQKGNETYLKAYETWLDEKVESKESVSKVLKKMSDNNEKVLDR